MGMIRLMMKVIINGRNFAVSFKIISNEDDLIGVNEANNSIASKADWTLVNKENHSLKGYSDDDSIRVLTSTTILGKSSVSSQPSKMSAFQSKTSVRVLTSEEK